MKRNIKNAGVQAENTRTLGVYYNFLRRIAIDSWTFEGLPFDDKDVYRHANTILNEYFVRGQIGGMWKIEDFYVCGNITEASPKTWYGGATSYMCNTFINTVQRDIKEVATLTASLSMFTDYDIVSIDAVCRHFASLLYEIDRAISVNVKGQNTPAIINAPEGQELTWANAYEQIAGHKPVVYSRDMSPLKAQYDDVRQIVYQTPATFVAGQLEQLKSMIMSDFMFMLGINNRTQSKAAQVSSLEVMQDTPTLMILRNSYEEARQNFCDQCNSKFGLNISPKMNDDMVGNATVLDDNPFNDNEDVNTDSDDSEKKGDGENDSND